MAVDSFETEARPPVQLLASEDDPCVCQLRVCCRDQVGFLSKLAELLTQHGIDVDRGEVATEDGYANNMFMLRSLRPSGFDKAGVWCQDLEQGLQKEPGYAQEEMFSRAAQRLSVNPDLLSVASFQELPERQASPGQIRYRLDLQGINQAGLLAYTCLIFHRSGFSVDRATICTVDGHVSDTFDLVANSRSAERILRSYLAIPLVRASSSSVLWEISEHEADSPNFLAPPSWGTDRCLRTLTFSNGDVYEGDLDVSDVGRARRHGFGLYTYSMLSHSKYKLYRGQWADDKKNGFGVLFFRDGSAYVGQWKDNHRHGLGVMFRTGGDSFVAAMPSYKYEGEWFQDQPDGLGIEEMKSTLYCGRFRAGTRYGAGLEMLAHVPGVSGCRVLEGDDWKPLAVYMEAVSSAAHGRSRASSKALAGALEVASALDSSYPLTFHAGMSQAPERASLASIAFPEASVQPVRSCTTVRSLSRETSSGLGQDGVTPLPGQLQIAHPQNILQASPAETATLHGRLHRQDSHTSRRSPARERHRSLTPERRSAAGSSQCPMLWDAEQLAAFFSHLGLGQRPVEGLLRQRFMGPLRLLEAKDAELHQDFGLTTALERLVARRAVQRLVESDRLEHSAGGRSSRDVLADSVLGAFVFPLSALRIDSCISEGGFGRIYKGYLSTGSSSSSRRSHQRVAVKEMKGDRHMRLYELLKEARVMASLRHPNICAFVGVCADDTPGGKRYLMSEMLDCSLYDLLHRQHAVAWNGSISVPLVIRLAIGICRGLKYLHHRNLVHADLKSPNILLNFSELSPRICDFGHAAVRPVPSPHDRLCTPHWAAPEVLRGEALGPAADVFSVGMLLWEMLADSLPHKGLSFSQVMAAVGWAGLLPDMDLVPVQVPERLKALMLRCLSFVPSDRPSAAVLQQALLRVPKHVRIEAMNSLAEFLTEGCLT
eukprot:TRINITY_DN33539_c0_g1_i1.p1 TRINITY_DN33539_c0_g1~~TRINITY_DN33539_c0_g1_i1.p1  ORF type:complete len:940 (-),score=179.98 TRINITY_DN33539_c0_g1_i1:69-2888(-)